MATLRHRCRLQLMPDYYQFSLCDSSKRKGPEEWTENNVQDRMHVAPGVVVVCPLRNMPVQVEVSIWDEEPQVVFNLWQHVVEAPLELELDCLEVHECCGATKAHFSISAGDYIVRALMRGLDTISDDRLSGNDFYEVQVWPGKADELRVIKYWPS